MALRRIFYCGERLDIEYNDTVATVATVAQAADAAGGGEAASGGAAKSRLTLPPAFSTVSWPVSAAGLVANIVVAKTNLT